MNLPLISANTSNNQHYFDSSYQDTEIPEKLELTNSDRFNPNELEHTNSDLFNSEETASITLKNIRDILSMVDEMRTILDVDKVEDENSKLITVEDYNNIIKVLNNYLVEYPQESKNWLLEIREQFDQFLNIKNAEIENNKHLNEINNNITSKFEDINKTFEAASLLATQKKEREKIFNEKKTKLESKLKIKQNQVHEKLTLVRNPATLESFNTFARIGSVLSAIAVAKYMKEAEIPYAIAAGIGFMTCRQLTNLASDYHSAVDSKNSLEQKLEELNSEYTSAEKKLDQEITSNFYKLKNNSDEHRDFHKKSVVIQKKKDDVQNCKNKMISNLMTKVCIQNIISLRHNAKAMSKYKDDEDLQLESHSTLKALVGSLLTLYFTEADDIQKEITTLQQFKLDDKKS